MKIAIAGYGLEGEQSYLYYSRDFSHDITIVDNKQQPDRQLPAGVKTILGEDAFENLQDFDLVIRTASLAPSRIKTNGRVWSATNEFFSKCPADIIGVTGTKGKGTTASLIASILESAGKKVWLVGNIGKSALGVLPDVKPEDIIVYELSSFQLWDVKYSPHTAVLLNVEQDHLDVHSSLEEYVDAKSNIAHFQQEDDLLVFDSNNEYSVEIAARSAVHKVGFPAEKSAHVNDGYFYYGDQKLFSTKTLHLIGEHNEQNTCAAIDSIWQYTKDTSVIERGVSAFTGLPHRLKLVREVDGVEYYDDSISTTPGSAIAAIKSFKTSREKVLILGGSSKGADFTQLASELANNEQTLALLVGDEADRIADACDVAGFNNYKKIGSPSMGDIVNQTKTWAKVGGVVLLSPACASFGMFKNYADRGEQFVKAVEAL